MERRREPKGQQAPSLISMMVVTTFSETAIAVGAVFGIFLLWIGRLISLFGGGGETAWKASTVFRDLGIVFLSGMLICGGIVNRNIEKSIRVAMVVMGALLIFLIASPITRLSFY